MNGTARTLTKWPAVASAPWKCQVDSVRSFSVQADVATCGFIEDNIVPDVWRWSRNWRTIKTRCVQTHGMVGYRYADVSSCMEFTLLVCVQEKGLLSTPGWTKIVSGTERDVGLACQISCRDESPILELILTADLQGFEPIVEGEENELTFELCYWRLMNFVKIETVVLFLGSKLWFCKSVSWALLLS